MLQALLPLLMGSMGGASAGMLAGSGGANASGMMGGAMPWLSGSQAPIGTTNLESAMPWLNESGDNSMLSSLLNGLNSGPNTMNNPMQQQAVENQNAGDRFAMVDFSPYSQVAGGGGRTSLESLLSSLARG